MQRQREDLRFRRAVDYVHQAAHSIKKINSNELLHLNQILVDSQDDTWRFEAAEVELPSGRKHQFNLMSNPIDRARDILGNALQMAGNQEPTKAALYAYYELVLAHLFQDANRRTAVLATIWILETAGIRIEPGKLLMIPLGDLRDEADKKSFARLFENLVSQA